MSYAAALRVVFAILAIAFFATPIAARVVGVAPEQFENRRFAEAPRPSQGWDAFSQASRFLVDRMALRAEAVRLNTRIWTDIFDTDPLYNRDTALSSDQALPFAGAVEDGGNDIRVEQADPGGLTQARSGDDGWQYSSNELASACDDSISNAEILRHWAGIVDGVRASERDAVLLVAPHKASVYPEHLGDDYLYEDCTLAARDRMWRLLAREGPPHRVLELRSELVRLKAGAGDGLFQRTDTHWSTLGALAMVDEALEVVGNGVRLEPDEIVPLGSVDYVGDLSVVGGNAKTDTRDEYGIERATDAPRVPGNTVLICDSFGYRWIRLFKPYFEHVHYVSWYEGEAAIARAVEKADTVIFEANELELKRQAADGRNKGLAHDL